MRRLPAVLFAVLIFVLVVAPAALAEDTLEPVSGEGTYGVADDKVVTNAGFLIIIAVPLFLLLMSLLQNALERRKERRKEAAKKLTTGASADWQSGW
jgi:hypothetical protein